MVKKAGVYVEKRANGQFAVERAGAKRAIALCDTQGEAIARANKLKPAQKPHVARVRHVGGNHPDQFRKVR